MIVLTAVLTVIESVAEGRSWIHVEFAAAKAQETAARLSVEASHHERESYPQMCFVALDYLHYRLSCHLMLPQGEHQPCSRFWTPFESVVVYT